MLGAEGKISSFRYWIRTQLHFDEVEKVSTKTPSTIKTFLRKYRWFMGKSFILVNVTFFFSIFAFFSGLLNDCLVELFLPAPPTLQLMTPGTWISTEGYRPFKRVSMRLTDRRKTAKNLVDSCKN